MKIDSSAAGEFCRLDFQVAHLIERGRAGCSSGGQRELAINHHLTLIKAGLANPIALPNRDANRARRVVRAAPSVALRWATAKLQFNWRLLARAEVCVGHGGGQDRSRQTQSKSVAAVKNSFARTALSTGAPGSRKWLEWPLDELSVCRTPLGGSR